MEAEIKALREEIAALRQEVASLRGSVFPQPQPYPAWPPNQTWPHYQPSVSSTFTGAADLSLVGWA